jgi:hypothetical protein
VISITGGGTMMTESAECRATELDWHLHPPLTPTPPPDPVLRRPRHPVPRAAAPRHLHGQEVEHPPVTGMEHGREVEQHPDRR